MFNLQKLTKIISSYSYSYLRMCSRSIVTSCMCVASLVMSKVTHISRPRDSLVLDHFIYDKERDKTVCQVCEDEKCGKGKIPN